MQRTLLGLGATLIALLGPGCSGCNENPTADAALIDQLVGEGVTFPDTRPPQGDGFADRAISPDDCDGDGLTNDQEQKLGTDPCNADTDGDGKADQTEVGDLANPKDSDGDKKVDALEPDNFDTDLDGKNDQTDEDDANGPCGATPRLFVLAVRSQNTTLIKTCNPYKVQGFLWMKGGATLTAEAGVRVELGPDAALRIGDTTTTASLRLLGTTTDPVELTAAGATPKRGAWRGIVVENAATVLLQRVAVRWAGGVTGTVDEPRAAVFVKEATQIGLDGATIEHAIGYGLHAALAGTPAAGMPLFSTFQGSTFSDVDHAALVHIKRLGEIADTNNFGIEGKGGEIQVAGDTVPQGSFTWRSHKVPYVFEEKTLTVDGALTLQAGVKIVMPKDSVINVGYSGTGKLNAMGTDLAGVTITSTTGAAGSWMGVILFAGTNQLNYLTIAGGGVTNDRPADSGLYADREATILPKMVTIKDSSGDGVYYYRNSTGCGSLVTTGYQFANIAKCKLYCIDDFNGGKCLVP